MELAEHSVYTKGSIHVIYYHSDFPYRLAYEEWKLGMWMVVNLRIFEFSAWAAGHSWRHIFLPTPVHLGEIKFCSEQAHISSFLCLHLIWNGCWLRTLGGIGLPRHRKLLHFFCVIILAWRLQTTKQCLASLYFSEQSYTSH